VRARLPIEWFLGSKRARSLEMTRQNHCLLVWIRLECIALDFSNHSTNVKEPIQPQNHRSVSV